MEKTDQENQAMYDLNESFKVNASMNELESNSTKPDPNTFTNNTDNTTIKRKPFKSPKKRDLNLKMRKFETLKSSS